MVEPFGDRFRLELHQGLVGTDEGAGEFCFVSIQKIQRARLVAKIPERLNGAEAWTLAFDGDGEACDFLIQTGAFELPDAMQTPAAHDHGFDMLRFGLCARTELGVEMRGESREMVRGLAVDDDGTGEEAVFQGVGRGDCFALGRDRPVRFGPVSAGRIALTLTGHMAATV